MKSKTLKRTSRKSSSSSRAKKNTLARHLSVQLGQVSLIPLLQKSSSSSIPNPSRFHQTLIEDHIPNGRHPPPPLSLDHPDPNGNAEDCILSQDFFCTPDYITPDGQQISNLDCNKEDECPKSPEKLTTLKSKRLKKEGYLANYMGSESPCHKPVLDISSEAFGAEECKTEKLSVSCSGKKQNFVSQSAVALRCRVLPPPCIRNPYSKETADMDIDPFGNQRSKSLAAGVYSTVTKGDEFSRYRTDFHEIEQIGYGNFSRVFRVLKRIDGCMYAVKRSIRQLHQDTERRRALMEVQALAALGLHENIVGYYNSWFEDQQLYIQMELCDGCLSIRRSQLSSEEEILEAMYQIAKALQFIHERGIAHLDVKPDNIYVKHGVYKLGDFGCATLIDGSLPIEEGDARYMPQEILNENYDHLEKVDIFSLGAATYELVRGSPLPKSGPHFLNLRDGKIPLLPGHSIQFQNLLKVMVDPDPVRRPSAKELLENPIFHRFHRP